MTRYTPLWLQQGSYPAGTDRRLVSALWPNSASTGCAVTVSAAMTLNVAPGQVVVPTPNNSGSTLCSSDAIEPVTLTPAPTAGLNRIDLIVCQARGNDLDGGVNNDFVFAAIPGAVAASPVVPALPAGSVALAQVYVAGAVAAIVAGNITDLRPGALSVVRAPQILQVPLTLASTSALTELTIATLVIPPQPVGYTVELSLSAQAQPSVAGDTVAMRTKVNGVQTARSDVRASGTNITTNVSVPTSQATAVAANTAATCLATAQAQSGATGTFTFSGAQQNYLTARLFF